jgi:dihydrofolate reductase
MRKLILHMMTTLDGHIAAHDGRLDRAWTNWDEEMKATYNDLFATIDTIIYGRVIYQEMVPAWRDIAQGHPPDWMTVTDGDLKFAQRLQDMRMIVLSTTLDHVEGNAIVIRDDLAGRISELKRRPGSDMLLFCGPALLSTLTGLGLVDEYLLYLHPTVTGLGVPLFRDLRQSIQLHLTDIKAFSSGSIQARYVPIYS